MGRPSVKGACRVPDYPFLNDVCVRRRRVDQHGGGRNKRRDDLQRRNVEIIRIKLID